MNTAPLAARARAAAPILLAWARRRALERSTWVGLGLVATALGWSTLGRHLTAIADAIPMIAGVGGVALVAATTSTRPLATTSPDATPPPTA